VDTLRLYMRITLACQCASCSLAVFCLHLVTDCLRPTVPRSPQLATICTCPNGSGAWASHRMNLAIPRDELQQRQREATEFWRRQLKSEFSAGVNATPQHEPYWLVLPSGAVNHQRSCDCELEITCRDTSLALHPSRHLSRSLNARKGSAAFHDRDFVLPPAASTLPRSPRPVECA
jgi:hypothetical protein